MSNSFEYVERQRRRLAVRERRVAELKAALPTPVRDEPEPVVDRWPLRVTIQTAVGMLVMLLGVIPMALALDVSNGLMDRGAVGPAEMEIIGVWDRWAFSPTHVVFAFLGAGVLVHQCFRFSGDERRRYATAVLLLSGVCVLAAVFVGSWFIM